MVGLTPDPFVPWVADLYGGHAARYRAFLEQAYIDVTLPGEEFGPVETAKLEASTELTFEEIHQLFATVSYYILADDREKARLDDAIHRTLTERFPGVARSGSRSRRGAGAAGAAEWRARGPRCDATA